MHVWEASQIKDLKLVIPECYTFMTSNSFFLMRFVYPATMKTTRTKSISPRGTYKTSPDISPSPKSLLLYCKQFSRFKSQVDEQPSSTFFCFQVSDYKAAVTPMNLVFIELDTHNFHFDLTILDEDKNAFIPRTPAIK